MIQCALDYSGTCTGRDVPPTGGSCVLFDSALVPHEAMSTRRERLVVAGWLHEKQTAEQPSRQPTEEERQLRARPPVDVG